MNIKTFTQKTVIALCMVLTSTFGLTGCDQIEGTKESWTVLNEGIRGTGEALGRFADLVSEFNEILNAQTRLVANSLQTNTAYLQSFDVENLRSAAQSAGASKAKVRFFYVQPNGSENLIGEKEFDTSSLPIGGNETETFTTTFYQAGQYRQEVAADVTSLVAEADESNNTNFMRFGSSALTKTEVRTFEVKGAYNPNLEEKDYMSVN